MSLGENVAVASNDPRRDAWRAVRPVGTVERLRLMAGWDGGVTAVDAAVDSGFGVLLLLDAANPGAAARAIAALYGNGDATTVVSGTSTDVEWMQLCSSVRDTMVALRPLLSDPNALLAADDSLAAMVAAILQAAARRTPIVIAGALPHIAAMAAQRVASPSRAWVFSALAPADAAAQIAQQRLALDPWASLAWAPGDAVVESIARALVADLDGT